MTKSTPPSTRVAFVTSQALPALAEDDQLAVRVLATRGVTVIPAVWDDPTIDWAAFDAIIIRSTWDYHLAVSAFHSWIDRVERTGVPIFNAPTLLRWNSNKEYLRALAKHGTSQIVPTAWVPQGDSCSLMSILTERGWNNAVVKPTVSAGAQDTWRTSPREAAAHEVRFRTLVARGGMMVQPFLSAITTAGEWSLLFFNGVFSHAIRKIPQQGDFRVQAHHGGIIQAADPDTSLIAIGERLVQTVVPLPLYARVDGCMEHDQFLLMELELIEPSLYLESNDQGATRFANALLEVLDQRMQMNTP
jgi:glutathione synthase/RimK-type ligase-like ATP-grasp enzyme